MKLLCDTGPLVAAINEDDDDHSACANLLLANAGNLMVPSLVITEVCYLTQKASGAETEAAFIQSIVRDEIEVIEITPTDWQRIAELTVQYLDLKLGVVDAAVIAVAERLKVTEVATLNGRDFRTVIPKHVKALKLLPLDIH